MEEEQQRREDTAVNGTWAGGGGGGGQNIQLLCLKGKMLTMLESPLMHILNAVGPAQLSVFFLIQCSTQYHPDC